MLNAKTALWFAGRIEAARAAASDAERAILEELRSLPDYEQNGDKDILEAVRLRAEARDLQEQADTFINSFDWIYDEASGENVRKPVNHD